MRTGNWLVSTALIMSFTANLAQGEDMDTLSGLPDIPETAATDEPAAAIGSARNTQAFTEVALGAIRSRASAFGQENVSRQFWNLSLDIYMQTRMREDLRLVVSDRLNLNGEENRQLTSDSAVNALRELYLGYGSDALSVEMGRINLRSGVGLGYNPTDYFRSNTIVFRPTEDPLKLQEMRLGVLALHVKTVSDAGGAAIALSPKVTAGGSGSTFDPRFQETNDSWRIAASASPSLKDWPYVGFSLLKREHDPIRLGTNVSAAIGRATIAHFEWSGARQRSLLRRAEETLSEAPLAATGEAPHFCNQLSMGASYTASNRMNFALEYEHNGAGLDKQQWLQLSRDDSAVELYRKVRQYAQAQQEIPTRQAWLARLNWPQFPLRETELTAVLRYNPYDHSRFAWIEARYNLPKTTFALAITRNTGSPQSEYGSLSAATVVNASAQFYF
jgi:hypothetical protein